MSENFDVKNLVYDYKYRPPIHIYQELIPEFKNVSEDVSRQIFNIYDLVPFLNHYANYEVIKSTLQTAVDFQWSKTRTVDELRSKAGMTVRQARELVKNELGQTRRWEDVQKKEVDNSVQKEEEDDE